jgi:hypothetical protein
MPTNVVLEIVRLNQHEHAHYSSCGNERQV